MAHKVVVSKTFVKNTAAVNNYLKAEWNQKVADDFNQLLLNSILLIAGRPGVGSFAKGKNVRKLVITKHNKLYYRVNTTKTITLLNLFDTRRSPKRNRYD
jgi:plasmid stabilization system protein ParE